mgnify:FL=1
MHELFYLNQLNQAQANLYFQMFDSVQRGDRSSHFHLSAPEPEMGLEDSFQAYCALRKDHPEHFFLGTDVHRKQQGASVELWAEPLYYPNQIPRIEQQLNRFLDNICRTVCASSQFEIEKQVYERLCLLLEYQDTGSDYEYDIVGPILYHAGVCSGISNIFALVMRHLRIPCIRIEGTGRNEGHAWNIVWINNIPCHVDLTWEAVCSGRVGYFYFNRPSSAMAIDHKWEYGRYPACEDGRMSIIDRTGQSFVSPREAELTIVNAFRRGEKVVRFHCDSAKRTAKSALSGVPCGRYQYSVNEAQNCGIIVKNT